MNSMDLETSDTTGLNPQYALEPFRLVQNKARITELSFDNGNGAQVMSDPEVGYVKEKLLGYKGKTLYFHNAVFDVAWLYALIPDINIFTQIDIRDTGLLAKWLMNSQADEAYGQEHHSGGYSLMNLVKIHLSDVEGWEEFVAMKAEGYNAKVGIGEDRDYWHHRAVADAKWTRLLAIRLQEKLPPVLRNGFLISQKQIPYVARAWVNGIPFNKDKALASIPDLHASKAEIAGRLGVHQSVLTSNSQLSTLLFDTWGFTPLKRGKSGKGSTDKEDLKRLYLTHQGTNAGNVLGLVQQFKNLNTLETKYINGMMRVTDYVGESVSHGSPKVFGTYTGRYTYASQTLRTKAYQVGVAQHQLPRKGPAKSWMEAPEGYKVGKYDASGQEIGFMAWASGDVNMISVLNNGMNVHSWMATNISGIQYDDFIAQLKSGDKAIYEIRQSAKLLNLSCQYRIGFAALAAKFFSTYDQIITAQQSRQYLKIYTSAFPGVKEYWDWAPKLAREKGYTESISGKRYYLPDWTDSWKAESSAINFPVQGSGGDQKDLIMYLVSEKFPEAIFALDIHDESVFFLPEQYADELNKEIVHFLNVIDYAKWWKKEIPMPLQFEGQLGPNFKDCIEYAEPFSSIQRRKELCRI